jgi:hypothetical protein
MVLYCIISCTRDGFESWGEFVDCETHLVHLIASTEFVTSEVEIQVVLVAIVPAGSKLSSGVWMDHGSTK